MRDGVKIFAEGQEWTIRLVCTGIKGDWPFLIETGALERHFRRAPKRGASAMAPSGVCHYCLAGLPGYSFADCSSQPAFESPGAQRSAAAMAPWSEITPFTEKLPMFRAFPPLLYKVDLWHNWHLGVGRYFIASCVVLLSELFPGRGVEARLAGISRCWVEWCRSNQQRPLLRKFDRANLGYTSELEWPEGCWQKASTTTLLMVSWMLGFPLHVLIFPYFALFPVSFLAMGLAQDWLEDTLLRPDFMPKLHGDRRYSLIVLLVTSITRCSDTYFVEGSGWTRPWP